MKMPLLSAPLCLFSASLLVTGCGGGGSSSVIRGGPSFTSWDAINPPTTVNIAGMSTESTYTAPGPSFNVTDVGDPQESQTASATLTYNSSGSLTKVTIDTPDTTITWDASAGDLIEDDFGAVGFESEDGTALGLAADPFDLGWNYQTFGIWITGFGTGAGTAGAISIGAPTAASAIPTTGNASFNGLTAGIYVDAGGASHVTVGEVSVDADFLNRSLDFSTLNTEKVNIATEVLSAANNLDITGTLTYSAGSGLFSGDVSATGLDGTAKGRFYGPNAEELGGHFHLTGAGVETYSGGFGARQ